MEVLTRRIPAENYLNLTTELGAEFHFFQRRKITGVKKGDFVNVVENIFPFRTL